MSLRISINSVANFPVFLDNFRKNVPSLKIIVLSLLTLCRRMFVIRHPSSHVFMILYLLSLMRSLHHSVVNLKQKLPNDQRIMKKSFLSTTGMGSKATQRRSMTPWHTHCTSLDAFIITQNVKILLYYT